MQTQLTKYSYISLTLLSLLCGLLWRIEVEFHGWTGLIWLKYFHWAVPVGFGLFLIWANGFVGMIANKKVLFNVVAIIFGALVYYSLGISLTYFFSQGPTGFMMLLTTPPWKFNLFRNAFYIIIPLMPAGTFFILSLFGKKVNWRRLILSLVGIIIAVPLSTLLLELVNHKGGHDYIHSIKSGFLMPLWCFSIGILFIGKKETKNKQLDTFDLI